MASVKLSFSQDIRSFYILVRLKFQNSQMTVGLIFHSLFFATSKYLLFSKHNFSSIFSFGCMLRFATNWRNNNMLRTCSNSPSTINTSKNGCVILKNVVYFCILWMNLLNSCVRLLVWRFWFSKYLIILNERVSFS